MVKVNLAAAPEPLEFYPWDVMLQQGFHWMDKYGDAHWIPDMDVSYLYNALRFAKMACHGVSNGWWDFAMMLNGQMATEMAMNTAERYNGYDVPLVKGLMNAIAKREGLIKPFQRWELEGDDWTMFMESEGMNHMAVIQALTGGK